MTIDMKEIERRMHGAVDTFQKELSGLRTGRASAGLVEHVVVDVYGAKMPLNQVATVSVPEARMITLQVWDKSNVSAVEKAIMNADLGITPSSDGQLIRLPLPDLTEERRKELAKLAGKYAEQQRVAVRNVRRDGMEAVKKAEKDGEISEDEQRAYSDDVQKLTDRFVGQIDTMLADKEKDIMTV